MGRVTIFDNQDSTNAFDLADILMLIEPSIDRSWRVAGVVSFGLASEQLQRFSDNATRMTDRALHQVAMGIDQTLAGEFAAFQQDVEHPSIVIRARRDAVFEVETDEQALLAAIKAKFVRVES
ncbi:MAG: hypothetical protein AAF513_18465 [Pseudomonadota bacterium]